MDLTFVAYNPKRQKTKAHARWSAYAQSKHVQDAVQAGATMRDFDFDLAKGYVTCEPSKTKHAQKSRSRSQHPLAGYAFEEEWKIGAKSRFQCWLVALGSALGFRQLQAPNGIHAPCQQKGAATQGLPTKRKIPQL